MATGPCHAGCWTGVAVSWGHSPTELGMGPQVRQGLAAHRSSHSSRPPPQQTHGTPQGDRMPMVFIVERTGNGGSWQGVGRSKHMYSRRGPEGLDGMGGNR